MNEIQRIDQYYRKLTVKLIIFFSVVGFALISWVAKSMFIGSLAGWCFLTLPLSVMLYSGHFDEFFAKRFQNRK